MKATMSHGVYAEFSSELKPVKATYRVRVLEDLEPAQEAVGFSDFASRRFILREEIDGDYFSNIVELEENGEVTFLETSREDAKKITGAWSVENNVIHMAIHRTHASRFAEYTVETRFSGQVEQTPGVSPVMGEIRSADSLSDDDFFSEGKFSLHNIGLSGSGSSSGQSKSVSSKRKLLASSNWGVGDTERSV